MHQSMTEHQARAVCAVLATEAGASTAPADLDSFVMEVTGANPTNQWRFCGSLGFGGKFWFPRMTVGCYPEDETPARLATIQSTKSKLAALREDWSAEAKLN